MPGSSDLRFVGRRAVTLGHRTIEPLAAVPCDFFHRFSWGEGWEAQVCTSSHHTTDFTQGGLVFQILIRRAFGALFSDSQIGPNRPFCPRIWAESTPLPVVEWRVPQKMHVLCHAYFAPDTPTYPTR